MAKTKTTAGKMYSSIVIIVLLLAMMALTAYAWLTHFALVDNNEFETGSVKIELNGGKVVFDEANMNIEPGDYVERNFTVENKSSVAVYYRLYLENVEGSLKEALTFSVYDGEACLYTGKASKFNKNNPCLDNRPLATGEVRTLTAVVKMDEGTLRTYETAEITFDITVQAVQAKNNLGKAFD